MKPYLCNDGDILYFLTHKDMENLLSKKIPYLESDLLVERAIPTTQRARLTYNSGQEMPLVERKLRAHGRRVGIELIVNEEAAKRFLKTGLVAEEGENKDLYLRKDEI